ncbi:hypothetical protein SFUMM280S_06484 [Streptomyces fumanus]
MTLVTSPTSLVPLLEIQPGGVLRALEAVGGHGVQVALAHEHVPDAAHLDLGAVLRVVQHPVPGSTVRTFCPTATTSAQASRRPTAAVAGIRMPPPERRSPSLVSCRTSTRSCSIRMGSLSSWVLWSFLLALTP